MDRFYDKIFIDPETGCHKWTAGLNKGYGQFRHAGKIKRAHRVAWELANGEIPKGLLVLHKCDVPECVNPDHLFLGTQKENMQDCSKKDRVARNNLPKGEAHHKAKLTRDDVSIIKQKLADGETGAALGREYGVSRQQISHIKHGRYW